MPFRSIPRLAQLTKKGRLLIFEKGDAVGSTDDVEGVFLVESGFVRRFSITNGGDKSVQIIYGPGDVFSLTYTYRLLLNKPLYSGPEVYFYEALDEAHIYEIPGPVLKTGFAKDPLLYRDLVWAAGDHLASCVHMLENRAMPVATKRVAHQLLYFAQKWSKTTAKGTELLIPLTQQEIADVLSLTRETVSSAISQLKKAGLLSGSIYIVIPNIIKLQEEAYS